VLSIVPMYQKTVTLRGNTANPGRFAWHAGMRISELIPDKQSLLTRNYWWRRTQLGLPAPQFEPVPMLAAQSQPTNPVDLRERAQNFATGLPICLYSAQKNCIPYDPSIPGQYEQLVQQLQQQQMKRLLQQNQQFPEQQSQPGEQNRQFQQYQPFLFDQSGASSLDPDQQAPGAAEQQGTSSSLAQRQYQVNTENTAGAVQKTTVRLVAPEIDWDYAVIERLDPETLRTSLIPFDLGKLVMQHDQSQDLLLQPGDVLSIFSQADIHVPLAQQTKLVQLEGEFLHAGTYSVQPGETLRQLIERAGGLTSDAYLYASQFTRESTRVIQQQRIDEYVQELQLEITRGTLAQSSSALNTAQDVASANAAVASSRELISRLQQIRASGRLVINLTAASSGASALPDLTLEDGDRFIVPPVPASINVVGSVYNQNSFLYVSGRRVADYLALAGGPNRDADKKQIFVIRADGSVVSRSSNSGLWGNNFYSLPLNPGDTVVVSEKTFRPTALRAFLEWSQLFSQLALGAAAISIIQ
jgi:protein involved in polysaccharide export with SLBB domain